MATKFRVTLTACVAGNPLKAWFGTTGKDDKEHVPDDVWEDQEFSFATLEEAKLYIQDLPELTTTHVVLSVQEDGGTWVTIFEKDRGEALAQAHILTPEEQEQRASFIAGVVEDDNPSNPGKVPEAPPLMPRV